MVELQILSKVLAEQSTSLLDLNGITDEYFVSYVNEYTYIKTHALKYGNVPDIETFLSKFPEFPILEVRESDKYLIDTFNEEYLYSITVPIITTLAKLLETDSKEAVEYLQSQLPNLVIRNASIGVDIISQARLRLQEWLDTKLNRDRHFITTGFEELDILFGGWHRGEELIALFSRTGQGKTFFLIKVLLGAWKAGYSVGLLEPEMSASRTGFRFDTLYGHFSNTSLLRGDEIDNYADYVEDLSKIELPFFVAHPRDFNKKVTVSKLRSWIQGNNIDILAIDGISYLKDERRERGDNRTTGLTNISEDLMALSIELKVPIIVIAQSNRDGASALDAPDLENIRDSDGIAYNASIVIALKATEDMLWAYIRKNRFGKHGQKFGYDWEADSGVYTYNQDAKDAFDTQDTPAVQVGPTKKKAAKEGVEVF